MTKVTEQRDRIIAHMSFPPEDDPEYMSDHERAGRFLLWVTRHGDPLQHPEHMRILRLFFKKEEAKS